MKTKFTLLTFLFVLILPTFFQSFTLKAAIIYVNSSASGTNDGTSWTNAFTDLTTALISANSGDEIWVATGVYKPTAIIDVNASGGVDVLEATFNIPDNVRLYGGFVGAETSLNERNWESNLTILSGDLDNNDVNLDGNNIAENVSAIVGNNAYHVVYTSNVTSGTTVDGFIITAGSANIGTPVNAFDPNLDGGGWFNSLNSPTNASSPTIVNTTFQGNFATSEGGAMYNTGPNGGEILSLIQHCKFLYNESDNTGGAIYLGSFSPGNYQLHLANCQFSFNEAFRRGGALYLLGDHSVIDSSSFNSNMVTAISMDASTLPGSGGGVNLVSSSAVFTACMFDSNSATGNPTGPYEGGGGGAIHISTNDPQTSTLGESEPKFVSCGFYSNVSGGNTAAWGGAVVHLNDAGILRPEYINCVFSGNQAENDGGAVANFTRVISDPVGFTPALEPAFTNCTFHQNSAGTRGGALYNDGFLFMGTEILQSLLENCILWNNNATVEGPEVYNTGVNTVKYSLVEGSGGSGVGWDTNIGMDGGNNIDSDPLFVDETGPLGPDNIPATNDDGLRLANSSPAINAGNNTAPGLSGIATDYTGGPRIIGVTVDMGAYEKSGGIIPVPDIYLLDNWRPLEPPSCLTCPKSWAFLLYSFFLDRFIWNGPAQMIVEGDSAIITGSIVNVHNTNAVFDVHLQLVNRRNWNDWDALGRKYIAYTFEALNTALSEHDNWLFWELSNGSYLEGTGDISGRLYLNHWPSNKKLGFQQGAGANGWDNDYGVSGLFSFKGKINYKGKKIHTQGLGSMNVDATLCPACVPLMIAKNIPAGPAYENVITQKIDIFPVPATDNVTIVFNNKSTGNCKIEIYDFTGRLRIQKELDMPEGEYSLNLQGLQPGVYLLKFVLPKDESLSKKLIIK